MSFISINKSVRNFTPVKTLFLNTEGHSSKFIILDSGKSTPYYFKCISCKKSSINIDHSNAHPFDPKKLKIPIEKIIEMGGTGTICKIINCSNCNNYYFVGIGYTEPNYGRDVLLLHTILELKEIT